MFTCIKYEFNPKMYFELKLSRLSSNHIIEPEFFPYAMTCIDCNKKIKYSL